MCYDSPPCKWFWFNPMTGEDGCTKPSYKICTAELEDCDSDEEILHEEIIDEEENE